ALPDDRSIARRRERAFNADHARQVIIAHTARAIVAIISPDLQGIRINMTLQREQVMAALRTVQDPELFKDIVTLNMVKDVRIDGLRVDVQVELTTPACPLKDVIEKDVTAALRKAGAQEAKVQFSANTRGAPGPR